MSLLELRGLSQCLNCLRSILLSEEAPCLSFEEFQMNQVPPSG
jgi:hypothetical protein